MDTAEWEKHTIAATCLEWSGSRAKDADACPPPPWCLADLTAMPAVCLINLSLLLCSQAGDVEKILLCLLCLCAHTQSFLSHMHKAHSGVPLKGTDSENMLQKGTHTSHFKAQHWKNTSKNKNNLSTKTTMVHFPLRKINSSQVRRCGQVHTEFLQQRKRKPSLCSVSKHNTDNLVWRRAQATVNNIFSVLRVNQERFTVQEFSWWVTLMASAVSSRWPLIPTSSQLQAADNEEYKGQSQCSHG